MYFHVNVIIVTIDACRGDFGRTFAAGGGTLTHLRSRVRANRANAPAADVLDWRFVAMLARWR